MRCFKNAIFKKVLVYVTEMHANTGHLILKYSKRVSLLFSCVCLTLLEYLALSYQAYFKLGNNVIQYFENLERRICLTAVCVSKLLVLMNIKNNKPRIVGSW